MAMFGGIALLPQYLQIVRGATPTESGLLMLPLIAGIMVGSLIVRPADRADRPVQGVPVAGTLR